MQSFSFHFLNFYSFKATRPKRIFDKNCINTFRSKRATFLMLEYSWAVPWHGIFVTTSFQSWHRNRENRVHLISLSVAFLSRFIVPTTQILLLLLIVIITHLIRLTKEYGDEVWAGCSWRTVCAERKVDLLQWYICTCLYTRVCMDKMSSLFGRKFNSAGIKPSMEISFFSESTDVLNWTSFKYLWLRDVFAN